MVIGDKFYVMFGYLSESGNLSNAVYEFNFSEEKWRILAHPVKGGSKNRPRPRIESAASTLQTFPNKIFIFGGSDGFTRMNDLWMYDVQSYLFEEIKLTTE